MKTSTFLIASFMLVLIAMICESIAILSNGGKMPVGNPPAIIGSINAISR
jgi:hypothetical protein